MDVISVSILIKELFIQSVGFKRIIILLVRLSNTYFQFLPNSSYKCLQFFQGTNILHGSLFNPVDLIALILPSRWHSTIFNSV